MELVVARARRTTVAESERRVVATLFAVATGAFLLMQSGAIGVSDGGSMYQVTRSIAERADVTVDPGVGVAGRDGRYYSKYGIGLPLVALPAYLAAKPLAMISGARADLVEQSAVAAVMPVISALLVLALYLLARRMGAGRRAAVLCSLGGVAGTFALPYSKQFFSEPLVAACVTLAIERVLARRPGHAAAALGLAVLTRPQTLLLLPLFALVLWRREGRRALAAGAGPLAVTAAIVVWYNLVRFGAPFDFGYGGEGFTTPFVAGARGLLLDPAKSVLLFAPVLAVVPFALARARRTEPGAFVLLAGNFAITFVLAACWWSWAGGWSWGPRFLLPAVVPLVAAVAPWIERSQARARLVAVLLAAGFAVSVPALVVSARAQQLDGPRVGPGIARQYALIVPAVRETASNLRGRLDADERGYVDLWQVNVLAVAGPIAAAAAAGLSVLIAGVTLVGASLLRGVRQRPTPVGTMAGWLPSRRFSSLLPVDTARG